MEPYIVTIYVLFGIGILGASNKWSHVGWAWYSVLFPAHAILISLATTLFPVVKAILTSQITYIVLVVLYLWCVLASKAP